jgi:hypothetical protein
MNAYKNGSIFISVGNTYLKLIKNNKSRSNVLLDFIVSNRESVPL